MRLKNRRTGEVKEVIVGGYPVSGKTKMWECSEVDTNEETGYKSLGTYTSLAELNEEWEDVPEEPKEYWYISDFGYVFNHEINNKSVKSTIEEMKSIGNYFLSREEAELAVRKLKAWKRLKDKGFDFEYVEGYKNLCGNGFEIPITATMLPEAYTDVKVSKDLDLLFGGEECN